MADVKDPIDLRLGAVLGAPAAHVEARGIAPRGLYANGAGVPFDFQVLDRATVWADDEGGW